MKRGQNHSAAARRRIAEATRAAMAAPEVRKRISEATKIGIGSLPELNRLREAWQAARPSVRQSFLHEVLTPLFGATNHP